MGDRKCDSFVNAFKITLLVLAVLAAAFLAGCRDDAVGVAWSELGDTLAALPTTPDCFGVVHNDLHAGNLLLADDGSVTVLDLDVASRHWYATDLAILLAHPLWDLRRRDPARMQPFVDAVVAAYLEQYRLPSGRLADVPLLMRYRLTLFVLAMRVVDLIWNIAPIFRHGATTIHWLDIAAVVGIGGVWLVFFVRNLAGRAVLPQRAVEPQLGRSAAAANSASSLSVECTRSNR